MRRFRIELAPVAVAVALILVLVLATARTAPADDTGSTKKPAAGHTAAEGTLQPSSTESNPSATPETKPAKTKKAKRRGADHLPPFFKGVVTDDQKEKIYAIQDEYDPKLKALKEQLKSLIVERDAKLDAVLTADQKSKVEAKRAEAEAKRAQKAEAKRVEAESKRAEKKENRGKSAKHIATPSTDKPVDKPSTDKPVEKPADQTPAK
jgi:cell division protein ZapA (FtsZ GTPase activity inhibitor)